VIASAEGWIDAAESQREGEGGVVKPVKISEGNRDSLAFTLQT